MAGRTAKDTRSTEELEREIEQLQDRLSQARNDQLTNSETLVSKLRRGLEAARNKERAARGKVAKCNAGKQQTPARQRRLEAASQSLDDARATTAALRQEVIEAQASHQGFRANVKRQAERAKLVARETRAYETKSGRSMTSRSTRRNKAR